MDDLGIGKLITGWTKHRDAIHVAVAPVIADVKLSPGQHIGVKDGRATSDEPHLGIVDPFLASYVIPGEEFWVFLYPGSITSLRHHWEHPEFPDEPTGRDDPASQGGPEVAESSAWLRDYASELGLEYDDLMWGAENWIRHGTWMNIGARFDETSDEFWDHYAAVTGKRVPRGKQDNFFTCSC